MSQALEMDDNNNNQQSTIKSTTIILPSIPQSFRSRPKFMPPGGWKLPI
jgi:hypothetical protein